LCHSDAIITLAAQYRLPAIYPYRFFTVTGGLMSYGIDPLDLFRRAASYVDRILKGANKFELVINLKTANTLGITIAPSLLDHADEVIE
jgi:putative ABC transport system substrate-binding protein